MQATARRRAAVTLTVAAALTVTVTSLAYLDTHRYVHLRTLAHPFLGLAAGVALLACAARLIVVRRALLTAVSWAAVLAVAAALITGARLHRQQQRFAAVEGPVVASSDRYQIVSYRVPTLFAAESVVLRLRDRRGLATREGVVDLACFSVPAPGVGSSGVFDRAEFTGPTRAELRTRDGQVWIVAFDPVTLAPLARLDRCADRP